MNAYQSFAKTVTRILKEEFLEIPWDACQCGKPVVFSNNKRRFKCSRCGNTYSLKIEIVPGKNNKLTSED